MSAKAPKELYIPALDGLRFLAFALVFFHHLPTIDAPIQRLFQAYGWIGVDLFFVISATLFFRLFAAEQAVAGRIDIAKFFKRRILRIAPLMVAFPLVMTCYAVVIEHRAAGHLWLRFVAVALGFDNVALWAENWNPIPYSGHLWTLSFECQVYAVLPFAFMAYTRMGREKFLWLLVGAVIWVWVARTTLQALGVDRVAIWTSPLLRPESIFVGLALAIGLGAHASRRVVLALGLAAAASVPFLPSIFYPGVNIALYPAAAVIAGAAVWLVLNVSAVARPLTLKPVRYLGKISYGLYVYHVLAIALAELVIAAPAPGSPHAGLNYIGLAVLALAITVGLSMASYRFIETPFLRVKQRLEVVASRPI